MYTHVLYINIGSLFSVHKTRTSASVFTLHFRPPRRMTPSHPPAPQATRCSVTRRSSTRPCTPGIWDPTCHEFPLYFLFSRCWVMLKVELRSCDDGDDDAGGDDDGGGGDGGDGDDDDDSESSSPFGGKEKVLKHHCYRRTVSFQISSQHLTLSAGMFRCAVGR